MEPARHLSWVPSFVPSLSQKKIGRSSITQPPATETVPAGQVPFVSAGLTQRSFTQVLPAAHALEVPQAPEPPVHRPVALSHE